MSGQHCENYDFKRETVHCYPRNVDRCCTCSSNLNVSLDFVSENIEILGKQNSLFPSGPVVKCLVFPTSPIAVVWLLANLEKLQIRPFSGFSHRSVYLLFAMGLGRKHSSAKGFKESLWIDFEGTNILFKPYLFYLGKQCFCLCNKVFLDGLASCHCTEKWRGTEYSGPANAN